MIIYLKNKHTLVVDEFQFRCAIGKNGLSSKKVEGDFFTPKGIFKLEKLYYREDRVNFEKCDLKFEKINNRMVWCNDNTSIFYNFEKNFKVIFIYCYTTSSCFVIFC